MAVSKSAKIEAEIEKVKAKIAEQQAKLKDPTKGYNGLLEHRMEKALPLCYEHKVKLITNLNDAIMMLVTGKVDAVAVDADNGALFAGNYDSIAMADFHFDYSSEGNVLAVTKGETELIEAINKILDEVNEKGLYKQWKDDATELAKSLGIDVN